MNQSMALSYRVPTVVGNLEAYIQSAKAVPFLSEQEEATLSRQYLEKNDLEAAHKLVVSHLRLVISIARGYLGYGLPHADLIQEGNVGLMKAVKRFNPDRGVRLVSFALHWIKAEIHEYILKNWRMVKIATTKAQRKLFFNLRSLKADSGVLTPEETQEIANRLNVRAEEVSEMELRLMSPEMSLEYQAGEDEDRLSPIAYLADQRLDPAEEYETKQAYRNSHESLAQALECLDERSRQIIEARWLQEDPATLHELAVKYGISAERIRQLEANALKKMRLYF